MKNKYIIFDFSNTLVKMRPATLLLPSRTLKRLSFSYNLAIITGAKKAEALNILNKLRIKNYFVQILTKDEVSLRKPNPKLFDLVTNVNKIVLYIGDGKNDAKMAKDAKINYLNVNDFNNITL